MKKNFLSFSLSALLLFFCGFSETMAQVAFASNYQKNDTPQPHQESNMSVIYFLHKLELIHKVNFVYQRELIEGKMMPAEVNENDNVETILKLVLPQLNLKFKKLKGGGYTILPLKTIKNNTINAEKPQTIENSNSTLELLGNKQVELLQANFLNNTNEISLKGKVIDAESNQEIPGVNIAIKGTKKGVSTNSTGDFQTNIAFLSATLI